MSPSRSAAMEPNRAASSETWPAINSVVADNANRVMRPLSLTVPMESKHSLA
jgi:hypothetical protein